MMKRKDIDSSEKSQRKDANLMLGSLEGKLLPMSAMLDVTILLQIEGC